MQWIERPRSFVGWIPFLASPLQLPLSWLILTPGACSGSQKPLFHCPPLQCSRWKAIHTAAQSPPAASQDKPPGSQDASHRLLSAVGNGQPAAQTWQPSELGQYQKTNNGPNKEKKTAEVETSSAAPLWRAGQERGVKPE